MTEEHNPLHGYNSGKREGKMLGIENGKSLMLANVIEIIQDMTDDNYRRYDKDSLATMLWKELNQDDD